jgi:threonyl-tRNA synthetase
VSEPNDHRALGQRLQLWHLDEDSPGMVHWHPRGWTVYRLLEHAARTRMAADGYLEVRTPQLVRAPTWQASGHWDHFAGGMFRLRDESHDSALKPVSCPGHLQIAARLLRSYRDLPLRLGEFGLVHRDEPGGTLHGLLRLRQFTQDDGHILCAAEQVDGELDRFCSSLCALYEALGVGPATWALSTRPEHRAGSDEDWEWMEARLEAALERRGLKYVVQPGAGAFYGPKIELSVGDASGRIWQCGTIQIDVSMPRRFHVAYQDAAGGRRAPVMLHRAFYGSLERFLALLLEHRRGRLPAWLAPEQVRVLPVAAAHAAYAALVADALAGAGLRASVDARAETLGRRVLDSRRAAIPFVGIVGDREHESGSVVVREGAAETVSPLSQVVEHLKQRCRSPLGG